MKTFGRAITEARKRAGLTQKEVAERPRGEDGKPVDAPYMNAVEYDRRRPPPNYLIEQLARVIGISAEVLFFTPTAARALSANSWSAARVGSDCRFPPTSWCG
jgi:transcriptional regulator with XRE-family HTH domain